jgi:hypothetical protein
MPTIDVDPVFIAIRIASYGHGMDIVAACPHCGNKNEYKIDLRVVTDNIKSANFDSPVIIDGLTFKFRPQPYKSINQTNIITFEQQRLIDSVVLNEELTQDEKTKQFNVSFETLRKLNVDLIANSIMSVTTEEGVTVTDREQINEFLNSCSRQVYTGIKSEIDRLIEANKIDPVNVTCENDNCAKDYTTMLTFDQANFFE